METPGLKPTYFDTHRVHPFRLPRRPEKGGRREGSGGVSAAKTRVVIGFDAADPSDEDLGDVVSMLFERERGLVLESTVQHMLQQVEEAFARLEAGT